MKTGDRVEFESLVGTILVYDADVSEVRFDNGSTIIVANRFLRPHSLIRHDEYYLPGRKDYEFAGVKILGLWENYPGASEQDKLQLALGVMARMRGD